MKNSNQISNYFLTKTPARSADPHINDVFPYLLNNNNNSSLPKLPCLMAVVLFDELGGCRHVAANALGQLVSVPELKNMPVPLENLKADLFPCEYGGENEAGKVAGKVGILYCDCVQEICVGRGFVLDDFRFDL